MQIDLNKFDIFCQGCDRPALLSVDTDDGYAELKIWCTYCEAEEQHEIETSDG